MNTLDTAGVRTLGDLLDQMPSGKAAAALAARLGVWDAKMHANVSAERATYPKDFARLGDDQLSTTNSFWISESGRVTELVGMLEGQKIMLILGSKQAKAAARSRIRKTWDEAASLEEKPRKFTTGEVSDESENDPGVLDNELRLALLEQTLASARAYKEACAAVVAGVSREISFRQAQMSSRLR
jgi:hypothetical protein